MAKKFNQDFAAIVLAAGEGKRMKSKLSKVLHPIAGIPMIKRTINILNVVKPSQIIIVVNKKNASRINKLLDAKLTYVLQPKPLGTADAARNGLTKVDDHIRDVAIMYGDDTAFYKPETFEKVYNKHLATKAKITFVTITKDNPFGLGRVVRKNGNVVGIIEEKDATLKQKKIKEINDGLYFFDKKWLSVNLPKLQISPVSGEVYLTDLVALAIKNNDHIETIR